MEENDALADNHRPSESDTALVKVTGMYKDGFWITPPTSS